MSRAEVGEETVLRRSSLAMGSGPSARRTRLATKVQVVVALTPKRRSPYPSGDDCNSNSRKADENAGDFVTRSSIGRNEHRMSYNDTSNAWKALTRAIRTHDDLCEETPTAKPPPCQKQLSVTENVPDCSKKAQNPMHLYCAKRQSKRDENCHYCGTNDSLNGTFHGCRVCDRTFHRACLERKCLLSDELSIEALSESENDLGWTCPICEDIFNLLEENEKNRVIDGFDKMVGNETCVDVNRYLVHRRESYRNLVGIDMSAQREGQEVKIFEEMDRDHSGTIEWWEYARSRSMKLLGRRSQDELLELATPREITRLESFFKKYDEKESGSVTVSKAKVAYGKWLLSFVKDTESIPNDWLGELPAEWLGISRRGSVRKKEAEVRWQAFLLMNAFHILCARPNVVKGKPFLPTINEAIRVAEEEETDRSERRSALQENDNVIREINYEEEMDPLERIKMRLRNKTS